MERKINNTERPPYGIIAVLMVGAFIAFLNNTLLNVALPSIMIDLKVETSTVQWLTTGYMLINGIMIPATAFLIEKYSVRRLFLVAIGLFTAGTFIGGLASSFPVLLGARMVQASGSAIMMPLLMNVMLVSFPIHKRGTAMGIFGLILMFAPAIGPTLSGWILEHYDWRMLFHFITPIAVAVFLGAFFLLKDKKEKMDIKLDLFSLLLSSIGFGGLLYGFSSAGSKGWSSPYVYATIIIGVISLTSFIVRQNRIQSPMLNFTIFRYPMFALSSVISMVITMAMFSGMLLLPIYVQTIRGFSPFEAGLMLLPGALISAMMSPITGRLFDRIGGRILAIVGLIIITVTTYFLSILTVDTSFVYLVVVHAIRMMGMSMVMMPVQTNGLNQLPPRYYPHGTAMNNTLQNVSGAIGTALLVTIMATREEMYKSSMMEEAVSSGVAIDAQVQMEIAMNAMLEGINDSFLISVWIAALALLLTFFVKNVRGDEKVEEKVLKDRKHG